jgi:hypothetical protein
MIAMAAPKHFQVIARFTPGCWNPFFLTWNVLPRRQARIAHRMPHCLRD